MTDQQIVEMEATRLYEALENLYGDLFLLRMGEVTLEDIFEGSAHDAMKVLKPLQKYRTKDSSLAIGQVEKREVQS